MPVLPGCKIHIAAGEYSVAAEIAITKDVVIIGEGTRAEPVVLNGNGTCRVLNVSSDGAIVRGLTVQNGSAAYGAGAFLQAGTISGCVFAGNMATGSYEDQDCTAAGVFMLNDNTARVTDCLFTNNTGCAGVNGGVIASPSNDDTAVVTGCRFIDNRMSGQNAGGLAYRVTLKDCVFEYNTFSIQNLSGGCACECIVYRSIFRRNNIGRSGGGVAVNNCTVFDSLIHGNTLGAKTRGAACGGTLYNCTIVDNVATESGCLAGVCGDPGVNSGGTLYNCILWGNTNTTDKTISNHKNATLNYCVSSPVAQGGTSLDADPLLKADFRLRSRSPCVDAGMARNQDKSLDATCFPQAEQRGTDLAGAPRIMRTQIDIGCYELSRFPTLITVR